jgi:hypothetical protein
MEINYKMNPILLLGNNAAKDYYELNKQFKEVKKSQRQNEQILSIPVGVSAIGAHNAVFLGIAMSGTAAVACAIGLGGLLLFLLSRLLFPRKKSWCNRP